MTQERKVKPLLKWAGNKAPLAPQIARHLFPGGPDHECRLISPFLGAGGFELYALANGLVQPAHCCFSDINHRLIGMWQEVQCNPEEVIEWLAREPTAAPDWRAAYAGNREAFNRPTTYRAHRSALLIWLNRAGFNGLYRENRKGEFNVPIGTQANGGDLVMPTPEHIREVSRLIQGVNFCCDSYETSLDYRVSRDRIYADPPYVPTSPTASFTGYSGAVFDADSQRDLAAILSKCEARRIVASNSHTEQVRALYPEPAWTRHEVKVHRSISRNAEGRGKVSEYLLVRA